MKRIIKLLTMVILMLTALLAIEAGASDGVCYIGDNTEVTYATLNEAISDASEGDTIHLLSDAELGDASTRIDITKSLIIDGTNGEEAFSIALLGNIQIINNDLGLTLSNVNVDLGGFHFKVTVTEKDCTFTLGEGAVLENGGATNGGAIETYTTGSAELNVVMEQGSIIRNCETTANGAAVFLNGGTLTLNSGALIDSCVAGTNGGAIWVQNQGSVADGKLVVNGGTIEKCSAGTRGGAIRINSGTMDISGDAVIKGNTVGDNEENIYLSNNEMLTLTGDFTGEAGISIANAAEGVNFGLSEAGVSGAEKLYSDADTTLVGSVNNGKLTFVKRRVCYIGDNKDEAFNTLGEAISAASEGDTIHLLSDAELGDASTRIDITKSLVIDGDNGEGEDFIITLVNNVQIINNGDGIKFTNTVIDLNGFHLIVTVTDKPCKFTLGGGAALENGGAVNGAAIETNRAGTPELEVVLDEGSVVRNCTATANGGAFFLNGGTLKINSGALIENCIATSGNGGAINLQNQTSGHAGKLVINGGTIENCSAGAKGGAVSIISGTLELSGDAVIAGNKKGTNVNNITLPSGTETLILTGGFTGSAGVNVANAATGTAFGTAENEATGAENIFCDTNEDLSTISDGGELVFCIDGECYIGDDKYSRLSIADAIATAPAGSVIHITKDASFGNSDGSRKTINKVLTFDGNNGTEDYTLTFDSDIQIMNALGVKFENVTLDLDGHCFRVDFAAAKLIFGNGAKVTGGGSGAQLNGGAVAVNNGGVLVLEAGSEISDCESKANGGAIFINGGVVNIEDGALVKNCTSASHGGGIYIQNSGEYTGTLTMSGGSVEGCASGTEYTGGGIYASAGKIEISGEAYVQENKRGSDTFNNIYLGNGDILEVGESFVGAVGITFSMNSEGTVIGSAKVGNTGVTSVNSITSDAKNSVFGWINPEGKIIWQEKPTMTLQTDYGTYDEGTKGIIRVVTMFNVAPTTAKLSGFGTYILDNSAFSEEELKESENKFYKTEQSILASGKGFITDIHTGNLDKAYTVSSFCYIEGVDEPCFTTLQVKSVNTADDVKMLSDATVAEYRERYEN